MKKDKKTLLLVGIAGVLILAGSVGAYNHYQEVQETQRILQEEKEQEERQRAEEERRTRKIAELEQEAKSILSSLEDASTDEILCSDMTRAVKAAKTAKKEIKVFTKKHQNEEEDLLSSSLNILDTAKEAANAILSMQSIDETIASIYDSQDGSVAMSTSKNDKIFRDVQKEIWKLPDSHPKKLEQYNTAISKISEAWNYTNDEWNYETSTLKVSVKPKKTSYTKYWICHIQTFSTQQLSSALCGGTYGNPRAKTSKEVADHNGVIGINGSGFSYSSGEPAPGKSMIKDGKIYNDTYSNGNIMCVTQDGGMFTAIAGMTVEDMLNRGVRDTYCFGPTLVENGKAYEITSAFQQTYRYQRTAVGMVNPGDYYILVVDGKGSGGSQGMTYEEMQKVFLDLNCQYAYNLDGGGSTTLVFKGRIINSLTDGNERPCADILYFIDAGDGGEGDDIVVHEDEAMLKPPSSK